MELESKGSKLSFGATAEENWCKNGKSLLENNTHAFIAIFEDSFLDTATSEHSFTLTVEDNVWFGLYPAQFSPVRLSGWTGFFSCAPLSCSVKKLKVP